MKKLISVLTLISVMLSCTACGEDNNYSKLQAEYDQLKKEYEALKADYEKTNTTEAVQETQATEQISVTEKETEADSKMLPLEIKDYGYHMSGKYLYCSVVMYNPNKAYMFEFPSYRVTARDADGAVIASGEHTMTEIFPEQTVCFSQQFFECDETPSTVDVEALAVPDYGIHKVGSPDTPEFKPFEIVNTSVRNGSVVGEINNPNKEDYSQVAVTVIFRDENGKIVSGATGFASDVKADSSAPFQISIYESDFTYTDNYEVSAQPWL